MDTSPEVLLLPIVCGIQLMASLIILLAVVLSVCGVVLWIFMLVDIAKRDFKEDDDRVVWLLIVALTSYLGATIYYFVIKRPADKLIIK